MHLEDRANLVGLLLHDGSLIGLERRVARQATEFEPVGPHLGRTQQTVERRVSPSFVSGEGGGVERPLRAGPDRGLTALDQVEHLGGAAAVAVFDPKVGRHVSRSFAVASVSRG